MAADLGFKEVHVDDQAGDVMAARGAGVQLVLRLHQPSESGKAIYIYYDYCITYKHAGSIVVEAAGTRLWVQSWTFAIFFLFVFLVHGKVKL